MISKDDISIMLKQALDTTNKQSKHIEELWVEIGKKQDRVLDLDWEIIELKEKIEELKNKSDHDEELILGLSNDVTELSKEQEEITKTKSLH